MDLPETNDRHYKIYNSIYRPLDNQGESVDVGIATQSSVNHLHNLVQLATIWKGPISVGMYLIVQAIYFILREIDK